MAHHAKEISTEELSRSLSELGPKPATFALYAGAAGLIVAFVLAVLRSVATSHNGFHALMFGYLHNFCFFVSLSVGAILFVMIQHVVRAGWGVTVRRLAEILANNFPFMAILFLPILVTAALSNGTLYAWTSSEFVSEHPLVEHKSGYLNVPFFAVRAIFYFGIWSFLSRMLFNLSRSQDSTGDVAASKTMEKHSAWGLFAVFLTASFAAIDWMMSLAPEWFSTMFGVYFIVGSIVGFFATMALSVVLLNKKGLLTEAVTVEHRHDIGKFMHGFVIFWAYIAFSQYLLIWYSDIPEETIWYKIRQENGWEWWALFLLVGHFVIPFFGLMNKACKRDPKQLMFWAVWLLVMHWVDLHYLIMPEAVHHGELGPLAFMDINLACFVGVGGLALWGLLRTATDVPLVPVKDPRLQESLAFHNI
ncbi:quinol:cytochrome C oxidoreductase [Calycomorphotria hydatis]|uniref:Quinol:cytochrome C oxidoreductase n=1 Tax=Calycomorphotria hydatis TaxID=2528027 RepID=A0A517T8X5_9PLAN|nr:quinol:cytochrome C oxidoreductase [Calycomorphotria hydatis]QDT64834.1 hypothetical protein V22_20770 [Calycomorphotria hydatis]